MVKNTHRLALLMSLLAGIIGIIGIFLWARLTSVVAIATGIALAVFIVSLVILALINVASKRFDVPR